jgi:hypothetical protein
MAAATINSEQPLGGSPLSAEAKLYVLDVTAPAANAQTSFTVTHGSITTVSKINIQPMNQAAADLGLLIPTRAVGILTVGFSSADLDGTENFNIWVLTDAP